MRQEDIRAVRRHDIVQVECQVQRYRDRTIPKSAPWTEWSTNFQLSAIARLYVPPTKDVPPESESEEEALQREESDDDAEILIDGSHSIERSAQVAAEVLQVVFQKLRGAKVQLEACLLKIQMIMPGSEAAKASPDAIAKHTLKVLTE